jgi:putative thioredoxin
VSEIPPSSYVLEGTADNFAALVVENSRKGLVVVDFWAPWVGPSLRQREMLIEVVEQLPGRFLLVTVNTDREKGLAHELGVKSLPACKLFRHGRVVEDLHGVQPHADYRRVIERHLGASDAVRRAAVEAWQAGRHDRAVQILAEGAMADPTDPGLPELMAKLLMRQGRHADALEVLRALPPELREAPALTPLIAHLSFIAAADDAPAPEVRERRLADDADDCDARFQLASLKLMADDYETALQQLIEIVRRDRSWKDDLARHGLLALFETLGGDSDLVRRYRAELFRLNY